MPIQKPVMHECGSDGYFAVSDGSKAYIVGFMKKGTKFGTAPGLSVISSPTIEGLKASLSESQIRFKDTTQTQ